MPEAPDAVKLILRFVEFLTERAEYAGLHGEDSIRYTFFHALTHAGYSHWQIELESPLPGYPGRQIDTRIEGTGTLPGLAAEFKYHREKSSSLPKPQLAGGLLGDLSRLAVAHHAWGCASYFIYVTDATMAKYLSQARHGCDDLILAPVGSRVPVGFARFAGRSKTLLKSANGFVEPGVATCVASRQLTNQYQLKVFSVEHTPDAFFKYG